VGTRSFALRLTLAAAALVVSFSALPAAAEAPANDAFAGVWARTDKPVVDGLSGRTWMWGPEAFTGQQAEPYADAPQGQRVVQYYDKSRMEITNPSGDPTSVWYVTNGLLVVELVTGRLQLGNNSFQNRAPATVNVAGDEDDPNGPTYATFGPLRDKPALPDGALVTQRLARDGTVTDDPSLAARAVRVAQRVQSGQLDHQIAAPFWEFMNSSGLIYTGVEFSQAKLFIDPYYATGYPIAEPYWANVKVGGTYKDVLLQCFERRCLTYTPDNPPGWQVEAGNVGRHYYAWRYPEPDGGDGGGGGGGGGSDTYRGLVTQVLDGDSIRVSMNNRTWVVDYIGINAPSTLGDGECYGAEAAARNSELVLGKTVDLVPDVRLSDWYGTLHMYVYVDDAFINDMLVREGYALAESTPPDIRYDAQLTAAQAEAQAANRGLWAACGGG